MRKKHLKSFLVGFNDGVNPFEKDDLDLESQDENYTMGFLLGRDTFQNIEEHLEHCIKNNIATNAYIEQLRA